MWVTIDHDYDRLHNWGRWYFNRWGSQIGKGLDFYFPGSDPKELIGLTRHVIQEWRPDPHNPSRDNEFAFGTKRKTRQEFHQFLNPGPGEVLINKPNDLYYFQWEPWVHSPTYANYPNTIILN